ncbi:MAG: hypothetical protein EPO21_09125 [Chloroflexota bacterium]|nr:MAG: hypothetical protein EPO21_09125 [Chloroflexota bacterium]
MQRHRLVGRSLSNVELKIVDTDGRAVPRGEIGEIALRTPR